MPRNALITSILALAAGAAITVCLAGCAKQAGTINRPPVVRSLEISPRDPNTSTSLGVTVIGDDPDGNDIQYRVEWLVNGAPAATTGDRDLFSYRFSPGDKVYVRVTPSDGTVSGEAVTSKEVVIAYEQPAIDTLEMHPFPVTSGRISLEIRPRLKATPRGEVTYTCRWRIADKYLPDSGTVITAQLKAGDQVLVEVKPRVATIPGKSFRFVTTALNGPPVIQSITLQSQDSTGYRYVVMASDPDSDRISFQLGGNPAGPQIDPAKGIIYIPGGSKEKALTIRVTDSRGSWTEQDFTVGD